MAREECPKEKRQTPYMKKAPFRSRPNNNRPLLHYKCQIPHLWADCATSVLVPPYAWKSWIIFDSFINVSIIFFIVINPVDNAHFFLVVNKARGHTRKLWMALEKPGIMLFSVRRIDSWLTFTHQNRFQTRQWPHSVLSGVVFSGCENQQCKSAESTEVNNIGKKKGKESANANFTTNLLVIPLCNMSWKGWRISTSWPQWMVWKSLVFVMISAVGQNSTKYSDY